MIKPKMEQAGPEQLTGKQNGNGHESTIKGVITCSVLNGTKHYIQRQVDLKKKRGKKTSVYRLAGRLLDKYVKSRRGL